MKTNLKSKQKPGMLKTLIALGIICVSNNSVEATQLHLHEGNKISVKANVQNNISNLMNLGQKQRKINHQSSSLNLAQLSSNQLTQVNEDEEPADENATQVSDEQQEAPAEDSAAQVGEEQTPAATEEAPAEEAAAPEGEAAATEEAPAAEAEAPAAEAPVEEVVEEAPKPKPVPKKKAVAKKAPAKKPAKKAPAKAKAKAKPAPPPVVEEEAAAPAEEAQAQTETSADAEAQAEAEAQAQAEAELQAQAEAEAQEAPAKGKRKAYVPDTPDNNQAAAVLAAANSMIPSDKPWAKMTAAERSKKKAADAAEKQRLKEKDELENPTVDADGNHIQTVAEAKVEAQQLQQMLDAGTAAVEEKLQREAEELAKAPVDTGPVKQEEDDGHLETVEEVRAKMKLAQEQMNAGLARTEAHVNEMNEESQQMPDFGALANLTGSLSNMGSSRKKKQMDDMAGRLGVEVQAGEESLPADELTQTLMERAKAAGKTTEEISAAMEE